MEKKPDLNRSHSPLQLFEELFEPLVNLSREISVRYQAFNEKNGMKEEWRIVIASVNGCKSPVDFRHMLQNLILVSLENLHSSLKGVEHYYWLSHIEYIKEKLYLLTSIVDDERFIFPNTDSGITRQHHFKSFTNCKLIGPQEGDINLFSQGIRLKMVRFAEIWLDVIFDAIGRLDLIHKLLLQSLKAGADTASESVSSSIKPDFMIQTDLSVADLGYLFRMFVKSGVIIVPSRKTVDLIRWITGNFQSKKREAIQPSSLRNKYFSPDLASLDHWESILNDLLRMINEERDSLLK